MNCKDFQDWMRIRDIFENKENPGAMDHLSRCGGCKNLYMIDQGLEKNIHAAFFQQEIPRDLFDKIELTLDHAKSRTMAAKLKIAGIAAFLVMVLVLAVILLWERG